MATDNLDDMIRARKRLNYKISLLELEVESLNKRIMKELLTVEDNERTVDGLTAQLITRHTTEYDWDGIRKEVGEAAWKLLVVPQPKRLADAVAAGKIKPSVIARYTNEVTGTTYVKIDTAKGEE